MAPKDRNRTPDAVDQHVGRHLRQRRVELGIEAAELDRRIDLSTGSVARFEEASRTIGSGALYRLGRELDVPISYFFEGLPVPPTLGDRVLPDPERDAELAQLLRRFESLDDSDVRKSLLRLVKSIADGDLDWK
jgi:transcriptional regulator with XRE-family HTH domain